MRVKLTDWANNKRMMRTAKKCNLCLWWIDFFQFFHRFLTHFFIIIIVFLVVFFVVDFVVSTPYSWFVYTGNKCTNKASSHLDLKISVQIYSTFSFMFCAIYATSHHYASRFKHKHYIYVISIPNNIHHTYKRIS